MTITIQPEDELTDRLYDTDFELEKEIKSNPKESVLPNVLVPGAIAGISAALGYLETEMLPVLYSSYFGGTAHPLYQAIVITGLGLLSFGTHSLTNYAYMKIARKPSHFGRIDLATSLALAYTIFNGSAWFRGVTKGWDMGYLGYPDYKHEVVKGLGKETFNALKIGNLTLPSYAHIIGILSGVGLKTLHLLNRVRPIKPIEKLDNLGHRINNYFSGISSKSNISRYLLKSLMAFSMFSVSAASTGHPAMGVALASVPVAYEIKNEIKEVGYYTKMYGTIAIEMAKAKAENILMSIRQRIL